MNLITLRLSLGTMLLLSSAHLAFADPAGRVGRLSYVEGTVSLHALDEDHWSLASLNYPVTSGNAFWTEPGARSEIQVGAAEIRMDESTELDVTRLDDSATQLTVPQGIINIHLRSVPPNGVQVMTPNGQINLRNRGSYHIDAGHPDENNPSPETTITVLEGDAKAVRPRFTRDVMEGETAILTSNPPYFTLTQGDATSFDDWAVLREEHERTQQTTRYISPQVTGYQDLDEYGEWDQAPNYGAVWYPSAVPVEWAPYRYGHWTFIQPWGWTWVDDAPWGFTPFHYGRWAQIDGRWAWCPGRMVVERPVYAPALVAFVGHSGWSFSISTSESRPTVGWVPLAPFEVFHPYYPASVTYVRNVNITNINKTVINNITTINNTAAAPAVVSAYANHAAATVIPSSAFTQKASVHQERIKVSPAQLAQAPITSDVSHIKPMAESKSVSTLPQHREPEAPHPVNLLPNAPKMPDKVATVQPVIPGQKVTVMGEERKPHQPLIEGPLAPKSQAPIPSNGPDMEPLAELKPGGTLSEHREIEAPHPVHAFPIVSRTPVNSDPVQPIISKQKDSTTYVESSAPHSSKDQPEASESATKAAMPIHHLPSEAFAPKVPGPVIAAHNTIERNIPTPPVNHATVAETRLERREAPIEPVISKVSGPPINHTAVTIPSEPKVVASEKPQRTVERAAPMVRSEGQHPQKEMPTSSPLPRTPEEKHDQPHNDHAQPPIPKGRSPVTAPE